MSFRDGAMLAGPRRTLRTMSPCPSARTTHLTPGGHYMRPGSGMSSGLRSRSVALRARERWATLRKAVHMLCLLLWVRRRVQRTLLTKQEYADAKQLFLTEFAGRMGGRGCAGALERYCKRLRIAVDTSAAATRRCIPLRCETAAHQWQWRDVKEILQRLKHASQEKDAARTGADSDMTSALSTILKQHAGADPPSPALSRFSESEVNVVTKAELDSAMKAFNLDVAAMGGWSRVGNEAAVTASDFLKCMATPADASLSARAKPASLAKNAEGDNASECAFQDDADIENMVYAEPPSPPEEEEEHAAARLFLERMSTLRTQLGLMSGADLRWNAIKQCLKMSNFVDKLRPEGQADAKEEGGHTELTADLRNAFDDLSKRFERDQKRVGREVEKRYRSINELGPLRAANAPALPPQRTASVNKETGVLLTNESDSPNANANATSPTRRVTLPALPAAEVRVPAAQSFRAAPTTSALPDAPPLGKRALRPLPERTEARRERTVVLRDPPARKPAKRLPTLAPRARSVAPGEALQYQHFPPPVSHAAGPLRQSRASSRSGSVGSQRVQPFMFPLLTQRAAALLCP